MEWGWSGVGVGLEWGWSGVGVKVGVSKDLGLVEPDQRAVERLVVSLEVCDRQCCRLELNELSLVLRVHMPVLVEAQLCLELL